MNWLGHGTRPPNGRGVDPWRDRLSDYLDDELGADERRQLETHLEACRVCAGLLIELQAVVQRADGLRQPLEPASELWGGIQSRLQARPTTALTVPSQWRSIRPWLAAAAVLAMVCVAGISWLTHRNPAVPEPTSLTTSAQPQRPAVTTPGRPTSSGDREYHDTVANLRRVVSLELTHDPRVLDVLDRNLAQLDRAIAEYEDALFESPGDERLKLRLVSSKQRKVDLLQHTATLAMVGDNQNGSALTTH
jgi:hypothetical protein